MKKMGMMLAIASFMVFFVACGNKTAKATDEGKEKVEAVATEGDFLTKYEAFVDKAISSGLLEKATKGDPAAATEWAKLVQDYSTSLVEFQDGAANFTPDQIQKYEDITKKWTDYVQKATGQMEVIQDK